MKSKTLGPIIYIKKMPTNLHSDFESVDLEVFKAPVNIGKATFTKP